MSQLGEDNGPAAQGCGRHGCETCSLVKSEYFLPPWIRKAVLWAGGFTAYSQFVSIALLSHYRYHNAWDFGRYYKEDGYLGESFLVLWLFSPGGEIGRNEGYPILLTIPVAAILATVGSAGLIAAGAAKRQCGLCKSLLMLSFFTGFTTAVFISAVHMFCGAYQLRRLNFANFDNPYEFFPMHGVLEHIGFTWVPIILYPVLSLWLFFQATRGSVQAIRGRRRASR